MQLLEKRLALVGAQLSGKAISPELIMERAEITRYLAENYMYFDPLRHHLTMHGKGDPFYPLSDVTRAIIKRLCDENLITPVNGNRYKCHTPQANTYLSGQWLEELACLASKEAGADVSLAGQEITWSKDGYEGDNEVDLIARKGNKLVFMSCKVYKASLFYDTIKTANSGRRKLMAALHEADNLVDHFGSDNDKVMLLATVDLIDEYKDEKRYPALFGKAAALNVDIVSLEQLQYPLLVESIKARFGR